MSAPLEIIRRADQERELVQQRSFVFQEMLELKGPELEKKNVEFVRLTHAIAAVWKERA
ncbi:hypothetical protein [Candidatus Korobacter versatilis]|uniref:hypothetical protein n=1 Tax=Candidatus Korobacter versatilis TaxID=658062 RepID=UPI0003098886|nr:hypothetical protein [Candidatus Koribacter versatilis]